MKTYTDQMQRFVQEYRDAGQPWPAKARDIARWLIRTNKWDRGENTLVDLCAKDLSRAMREEYHTDPQGRRVRTKHAAADDQGTLWDDIRTAPRQFMERAFAQRRVQIVGDCVQLKTDVDSFNDNVSSADPIQLLLNFTNDVNEATQPKELLKLPSGASSDLPSPFGEFDRDVQATEVPPEPFSPSIHLDSIAGQETLTSKTSRN